jgi:endoglucanase
LGYLDRRRLILPEGALMLPVGRCRTATLAVLALGVAGHLGCGGFQLEPADGGGGTSDGAVVVPVVDLCQTPDNGTPVTDYPQGLKVVGNHIEDSQGTTISIRGVNRSGTEYKCVQGGPFFDGPCDEPSVRAIASWNVNAVRVPLNESCWLANDALSPAYSGDNYKTAIRNYVKTLHKYHLIPILELHWAAPGTMLANQQLNMPNADNTPRFWTDVATTFLDDKGVVFEPFNEPVPPGSNRNPPPDSAWDCWTNGCMMTSQGITYQAAGMQSLVNAIRQAGADHLILLGGVQYSNILDQWRARQPIDPLGNQAAAWHIYNNNPCATADCWNAAPADLATTTPIVATEIGELDCMGTFIAPLMGWLDQHGGNYLAWSWNAFGSCSPSAGGARGNPLSLVTDYYSGIPNGTFGQTFHDHLVP